MNEVQRYLLEEFAEEYQERRMTRRDLIRRAVLIMGSVPAGVAALGAVGCGGDDAEDAATATAVTAAATTAAATRATASASVAASTASATAAAPAGVKSEDLRFKGPGSDLLGYLAQPSAAGRYAGILIIHENRGLLEHTKDVARRYAAEGFAALAVDLVSRGGGSKSDTTENTGALGRARVEDLVADLTAYAGYLKGLATVRAAGVGVVGFCFGGGYTWEAAVANPDVRAAVPYYGFIRAEVMEKLATTPAAVMAVYAERDTRITSQQDQVKAKLEQSGRPFDIRVYAGANHGFFNDTGGNYNAEASKDAFTQTVEWFRKYLA